MSLHPFLPTAEAEQKASRFPIPASSAVVFAAAVPLAETESTFRCQESDVLKQQLKVKIGMQQKRWNVGLRAGERPVG
ncbi:hypothetical protein B296_00046845, partial [Ensete ventricosum]